MGKTDLYLHISWPVIIEFAYISSSIVSNLKKKTAYRSIQNNSMGDYLKKKKRLLPLVMQPHNNYFANLFYLQRCPHHAINHCKYFFEIHFFFRPTERGTYTYMLFSYNIQKYVRISKTILFLNPKIHT